MLVNVYQRTIKLLIDWRFLQTHVCAVRVNTIKD